jgi:hypothetical protein
MKTLLLLQLIDRPWKRLLVITCSMLLFMGVAVHITNPQGSFVVSLIAGILATPHGGSVTRWVNGAEAPSDPTRSSPRTGFITVPISVGPVSALYIFFANVYALLSVNILSLVLLAGFDHLEKAKMLSFSDLGYTEIQKYIFGVLFMGVWIPIVSICVGFMASRGKVPFGMIALGTGLSLPAYFLAAHALGLTVGLGNGDQAAHALGVSLPSIHGYQGLQITAILIQVFTLVAFGVFASLYMWSFTVLSYFTLWVAAKLSRFVSVVFSRY